MSGMIVNVFFLILISNVAAEGWLDYIKTVGNYIQGNPGEDDSLQGLEYAQKIPYEVTTADEKFISEAAKLTGVALSELDSCQQRVVLKLQMDCHRMNDEQVAKMAVQLLNCQSYVEGRPMYPCTDQMPLKDCTTNMDSDTWTSYHLMSNRARAVCYQIRQVQFRGLAEHTVNKLMSAARNQLSTLGKIAESQENLQDIAEHTLDSLSKGHDTLKQQQKDIERAQLHGQLALETNINKLFEEKRLIIETHNHLAQMTKAIQDRLDDSTKQLESQVKDNKENHQELLEDLIAIQHQAHVIFQRIEDSSELLTKQNEEFKRQYSETLKNLAEVNRTVHNLVLLVGGTRQALEERLTWISSALGGTDMAVERLYLIIWHSAFMLTSMLSCAFLSAKSSTRFVVATIPPLNLAVALLGEDNHLQPLGLFATIMTFILGQFLLGLVAPWKKNIAGALAWKVEESPVDSPMSESDVSIEKDSPTLSFKPTTSTTRVTTSSKSNYKSFQTYNGDELGDEFNAMGSPTPPLSRRGFYDRSRSRSQTPLLLNGSLTKSKSSCQAKTRQGTPCKLSCLAGRDFCYRHQSGDSVMG